MTPLSVDRVVLSITQSSIEPRHRPDDELWELTPDCTDDFRMLVDALLAQTTVNERATLSELLWLSGSGEHELAQGVLEAGGRPMVGGIDHELVLYQGERPLLSMNLGSVRLSSHYHEVFAPQLARLGWRTTTRYGPDGAEAGPPVRTRSAPDGE